jgi:hypothetical protein
VRKVTPDKVLEELKGFKGKVLKTSLTKDKEDFILAGFVIAYQFVAPAPPRTITMATGSPQGTYFSTGQAYQEILAREGVTLNLINTAGSIENIKLLETASEKVDIDFREFILSPFHDRKCPPPPSISP